MSAQPRRARRHRELVCRFVTGLSQELPSASLGRSQLLAFSRPRPVRRTVNRGMQAHQIDGSRRERHENAVAIAKALTGIDFGAVTFVRCASGAAGDTRGCFCLILDGHCSSAGTSR